MRLTLLAFTVLFLGCATIGRVQIDPVPAPPVVADDGRRVVVVLVDGLGHAELGHYLARLKAEDYEPDWPSGIAQLRRDGYRLAAAGRAEAPIPGTRTVSAATVATGGFPDEHGIVGEAFVTHGESGGLQVYDFGASVDATQVWRAPNLSPATAGQRPLSSRLLERPTWYTQPAALTKTSVIFSPFGEGSHWIGPRRIEEATAALRRSPLGSAATPLLDRAARDTALAFLLGIRPFVLVHFHGVLARGCFDAGARCAGGDYDHQRLRQTSIRELDHHLARILKRYAIERPRAYEKTHFFIVGTGGQLGLANPPDPIHRLGREAVLARLAAQVRSDECKRWWAAHQRGAQMVVIGSGGSAQIGLPRRPRGQENLANRDRRCLSESLSTVATSGDWLDAAVFSAPTEDVNAGSTLSVSLNGAFAATLDTSRRERVIRKLSRATTAPHGARGGDALLFAKTPYVFVSAQSDESVGHVRQGGLTDAESRIGLLVASRALEEDIANGFRIAPLELNDLPATINEIMGLGLSFENGRPPFLEWIDGPTPTLGFVQADRTIRPTRIDRESPIIWSEAEDAVTLGRREASANWPPDAVHIRFGALRATWDADKESFSGDGQCTYFEDASHRRWSCKFPVERAKARVEAAVVRREPGLTSAQPTHETSLFPVILGRLEPEFSAKPEVVCASENEVQIRSHGQDPLAISRVEVFVADDRIGPKNGLSGSLSRGADMSRIEPHATCTDDALKPACRYGLTGPPGESVKVPFPTALLEHHRRVRRLGGSRAVDTARVQAAFREAGGHSAGQPQSAWLGLRVCNLAGVCREQALMSDVDYLRVSAEGCP